VNVVAPLPEGIDGHFGKLRRFVPAQYHQGSGHDSSTGEAVERDRHRHLQAAKQSMASPTDKHLQRGE
jgi:hypothetical protein